MVGNRRTQSTSIPNVPYSNHATRIKPVQMGRTPENLRFKIPRIHPTDARLRDNRVPQKPTENILQHTNRMELTPKRVR